MANYFEHVLELPLAFHTATHSGRVLKVMLEGSNGMAWLWLGFFREHLAAFVALVVLLPLTLFLNWRLGAPARRRWSALRRPHRARAAQDRDAAGLGRALPFEPRRTRLRRARQRPGDPVLHPHRGGERGRCAASSTSCCRPRTRCCPGGRSPRVATRASATITVTAIFLLGTWLHLNGLATIGEIVTFMSIATMLIGRLEQAVELRQPAVHAGAEDAASSSRSSTRRPPSTTARTPRTWRASRARSPSRTSASPTMASARPCRTCRSRCSPARPWRSSARPARASRPRSACCTGPSIRNRACIRIDGDDIRDLTLPSLRRNIGVVFQEPMLFARSIRENLQVGRPDATDAEMIDALERAQAIEFITRQTRRPRHDHRRARPLAVGRRAPAPVHRPRAPEEPADPDPRRGDERARRRHRAQAADGARRGDAGPHDLRDRPSPRDDPQRRPHPRLRSGSHRRDRHLRRARRQGRPLRRRWPGRSSWPARPSRARQRRRRRDGITPTLPPLRGGRSRAEPEPGEGASIGQGLAPLPPR